MGMVEVKVDQRRIGSETPVNLPPGSGKNLVKDSPVAVQTALAKMRIVAAMAYGLLGGLLCGITAAMVMKSIAIGFISGLGGAFIFCILGLVWVFCVERKNDNGVPPPSGPDSGQAGNESEKMFRRKTIQMTGSRKVKILN
ncbi:MAG: hypothetical protein LBI69_01245 [Puniceicoccales bacterium]|jgi:predicted lipid-binding transport protein (Tim44 family)|nr:hypothetical protein [Puniceicoccales bacterium]